MVSANPPTPSHRPLSICHSLTASLLCVLLLHRFGRVASDGFHGKAAHLTLSEIKSAFPGPLIGNGGYDGNDCELMTRPSRCEVAGPHHRWMHCDTSSGGCTRAQTECVAAGPWAARIAEVAASLWSGRCFIGVGASREIPPLTPSTHHRAVCFRQGALQRPVQPPLTQPPSPLAVGSTHSDHSHP